MKQLTITMTPDEVRYGWVYFAVQFFLLPTLLQYLNALLPVPLSAALLNAIYFAINFLCTGFLFRNFLRRSFAVFLRTPIRVLRYACIFLSLYFIGNFLCSQLTYALRPDFINLNDQSIAGMTQQNYLLVSVGTVLLVPVAEETLFRGLIFGQLYNKNPIAAYTVSTLAFAAVHVVSYIGQYDALLLLLSILQYVPAGIFLGLAYAKTDTIWASIFMHITINQIGMLAIG